MAEICIWPHCTFFCTLQRWWKNSVSDRTVHLPVLDRDDGRILYLTSIVHLPVLDRDDGRILYLTSIVHLSVLERDDGRILYLTSIIHLSVLYRGDGRLLYLIVLYICRYSTEMMTEFSIWPHCTFVCTRQRWWQNSVFDKYYTFVCTLQRWWQNSVSDRSLHLSVLDRDDGRIVYLTERYICLYSTEVMAEFCIWPQFTFVCTRQRWWQDCVSDKHCTFVCTLQRWWRNCVPGRTVHLSIIYRGYGRILYLTAVYICLYSTEVMAELCIWPHCTFVYNLQRWWQNSVSDRTVHLSVLYRGDGRILYLTERYICLYSTEVMAEFCIWPHCT